MRSSLCRRAACVAACLALAFPCGCGKKQDTVAIGVVLPLSGGDTGLGSQYLNGLTLAVEELNAAQTDVVYALVVDDGSDGARAAAAFTKQVTKDKIAAEVTATQEAALAVGPKAEIDFVPLFANCDHPMIVTMFRDVFRTSTNALLEIRRALAFIAGPLGAKSVAFMYADDPAGKLAAGTFKNEIPPSGLALAASEPFDAAGSDPSSSTAAIAAQRPDAVLVHGAAAASARVAGALRRSGFRGPIVGTRELAAVWSGGTTPPEVEGCYAVVPLIALTGPPAGFAARYRARFNADPTANVVVAYDVMRIIAKADAARRVEEMSLVNALKKLGDLNGEVGPYAYFEREWTPPMVVVRMQDGRPQPVR